MLEILKSERRKDGLRANAGNLKNLNKPEANGATLVMEEMPI